MNFPQEVLHLDLKKQGPGVPPESILDISNLNVSHHDHHILKNINLSIPKGKITAFLGPSGCGKTTLLKSINRLTDLHGGMKVKGSIKLNGKEILNGNSDLPDLRQKMGLLSLHPIVPPV